MWDKQTLFQLCMITDTRRMSPKTNFRFGELIVGGHCGLQTNWKTAGEEPLGALPIQRLQKVSSRIIPPNKALKYT